MRFRLSRLLIATLIAGLLVCFIIQPRYFPTYESEWIGRRQDCPKRVLELIEELKDLPQRCTYDELVSRMKSHGFEIERDHYKDLTVHWIIDGLNLNSRRLVLSLTLWPMLDGEIFDARISETPPNGGWTEIWRIKYRELTTAG